MTRQRTLTFLWLALMVLGLAVPTQAQEKQDAATKSDIPQFVLENRSRAAFRSAHPLLGRIRTGSPAELDNPLLRQQPVPQVSPLPGSPYKPQVARVAGQQPKRVSKVKPSFYAWIEVPVSGSSLVLSQVVRLYTDGTPSYKRYWGYQYYASANHGGVIGDDGVMRAIEADYREYGGSNHTYAFGYYRCYNVETGKPAIEGSTTGVLDIHNSFHLYSVAGLTQDPETGKFWGIFELDEGEPYLGTINLPTDGLLPTRGKESTYMYMNFVNIFFGTDGQLFGIGDNGWLYTIDKETGELGMIGNTDVNFLFPDGSYYTMGTTYDPKTRKAYWSVIENIPSGNYATTSSIYEIDLSTGRTSLVCNIPSNLHVATLKVMTSEISGDTPAKVTDLRVVPDEDNPLNVTVKFTTPTTTIDGDAMEGELSYVLKSNGEEIATGTALPGTPISVRQEGMKAGAYTFSVVVSNDKGESQEATLDQFIGSAYKAPTNVKFTLDGTHATISWTAVTRTERGEAVDKETLTYRVVRQPDGALVADGLKETQTTDELDEHALAYWYYEVYAMNGQVPSQPGVSQRIRHGENIVPPFVCDFEDVTDINLFNIINANNDVQTWTFSTPLNVAQPGYWPWNAVYYASWIGAVDDERESSLGADDYLVTAPIQFKAGQNYNLRFSLRTGSIQLGVLKDQPESFELLLTDTPDPRMATLKQRIAQKQEFKTATKALFFDTDVTVQADGLYYLAWHVTTPPDAGFLWLDDIEVGTSTVTADAPAAATDVVVTPGAEGALEATISFKAPATTYNGGTLTSLDSILVIIDGETTVHKFVDPTPGEALSYVDRDVTTGEHTYTVTPYAGGKIGLRVNRTVVVGNDVPGGIDEMWVRDNLDGQSLTIFTEEPGYVGKNGGYVNPKQMGLRVYDVDPSTGVLGGIVAESQTASEVTLEDQPINGDSTYVKSWVVGRYNRTGESTLYYSPTFVMGKAKTLPIVENFKNDQTGYDNKDFWWMTSATKGGDVIFAETSSDGDGRSMSFTFDQGDDFATLSTMKFTLKGAAKPVMTFDYFAFPGDDMQIQVFVNSSQHEKNSFRFVKQFDHQDLDGDIGWFTAYVDLSEFKNEDYIYVTLQVIAGEDGLSEMFDNFRIYDEPVEYDLNVNGTSAPTQLYAGNSGMARVVVNNAGSLPVEAGSYTVKFYAGDELLANITDTKALAATSLTTSDYAFYEVPVTALAAYDDVTKLRAEVVFDKDMITDNNTAELTLNVVKNPHVGTVTNLTDGGNNTILWTAPTEGGSVYGDFNESFEDMPTLTANGFGGWSVYDGDRGEPYYSDTRASFSVLSESTLDYAALKLDEEGWRAHSGVQFVYGWGNHISNNDDWLFSPELPGNAFTLKYYAMEPSTHYVSAQLEILYSTTGRNMDDFQPVVTHEFPNNGTNAWIYKEVDIPEGAKYFAFHNNTRWGNNGIKIDDVNYPRFIGDVTTNDIVGYNIYNDNRLLLTIDGNVATTLANVTGGRSGQYRVSVLYGIGGKNYESELSEPAAVELGVKDIVAGMADGEVSVYDASGQLVARGANALSLLRQGVYVVRYHRTGTTVKVIKK